MLGCRCQLQEKEINPPDVTPAVCVVLSPGSLGAAAVTCGGGSSRPTSGPLPKPGDRDPAGWRPHRGGSQRCPGAAGPAESQRERQSRLRPGPGAHSTAPPSLFCLRASEAGEAQTPSDPESGARRRRGTPQAGGLQGASSPGPLAFPVSSEGGPGYPSPWTMSLGMSVWLGAQWGLLPG